MTRLWRYFRREVSIAVLIILGLGVFVSVAGVLRAQARIEVEGLRRQLCEERLKNLERRSAFLERLVRPENPCVALAIVEAQP